MVAEELKREDGPSLRAARALYARRHDPNLEVDMPIGAAMSGVRAITVVPLLMSPPCGHRGAPR
jgi:hypothetical protein